MINTLFKDGKDYLIVVKKHPESGWLCETSTGFQRYATKSIQDNAIYDNFHCPGCNHGKLFWHSGCMDSAIYTCYRCKCTFGVRTKKTDL